jgi:hypothetical protein
MTSLQGETTDSALESKQTSINLKSFNQLAASTGSEI